MNKFENLNERVENAVHKFHQSEELRRRENKSLSRILNDLEIKFEARTAELADCRLRIKELEESNVSLNALVCQLVDMVEKSADEIAKDPLYRASAAASEIVERYVAETPANDEAGAPAAPEPAAETERASAPEAASAAVPAPAKGALSDGTFEDIEEEYLLAEDLYERSEGASEFPRLVYDAIALARGEETSQPAPQTAPQSDDAPVETPEPEAAAADPADGGDLDIKEIMARLEIAAERAQLRADDDARRDRERAEAEVPDQAVGGRA